MYASQQTVSKIMRDYHSLLREMTSYLSNCHISLDPKYALTLYTMPTRVHRIADMYSYYFGTNVTYMLKDLVEAGYIELGLGEGDSRAKSILITKEGEDLRKLIDFFFSNQP